ncbi:MAG: NUDIX hydrolase [bacterium]|nr:NUDIX hydrolase [bacterium]
MKPEIPEHFYRVSVKGLILDETRTKFLVTQEDDGHFELPGGGKEHLELPQDCLRREIREEMGLETTWIAENPSFFLTFNKRLDKDFWLANILYEAKLASLAFTPSDECIAIRFVTAEEALALTAYENVYKLAKLFQKSQEK